MDQGASMQPTVGIYRSPNPDWILYMIDYAAYRMITREDVNLVLDQVHALSDAGCCVRCGPVGLFGGHCWMYRIASYALYLMDAGINIEKRG